MKYHVKQNHSARSGFGTPFLPIQLFYTFNLFRQTQQFDTYYRRARLSLDFLGGQMDTDKPNLRNLLGEYLVVGKYLQLKRGEHFVEGTIREAEVLQNQIVFHLIEPIQAHGEVRVWKRVEKFQYSMPLTATMSVSNGVIVICDQNRMLTIYLQKGVKRVG